MYYIKTHNKITLFPCSKHWSKHCYIDVI